jgi:hypothetical protein
MAPSGITAEQNSGGNTGNTPGCIVPGDDRDTDRIMSNDTPFSTVWADKLGTAESPESPTNPPANKAQLSPKSNSPQRQKANNTKSTNQNNDQTVADTNSSTDSTTLSTDRESRRDAPTGSSTTATEEEAGGAGAAGVPQRPISGSGGPCWVAKTSCNNSRDNNSSASNVVANDINNRDEIRR